VDRDVAIAISPVENRAEPEQTKITLQAKGAVHRASRRENLYQPQNGPGRLVRWVALSGAILHSGNRDADIAIHPTINV
jgi:hypothetical protein